MATSEIPPAIEHLRREQANAVCLYLQYKGYHWNVNGPLFHDLHKMFDEHAAAVFETIDELAERQRMLGAVAHYTLDETRHASSLPHESSHPTSPREMVERLRESHRFIIEGLKLGFRAAEHGHDPGSADLFAKVVQIHEKQEWFLRELLEGLNPLLPEVEGAGVPATHGGAERPAQHVSPMIH